MIRRIPKTREKDAYQLDSSFSKVLLRDLPTVCSYVLDNTSIWNASKGDNVSIIVLSSVPKPCTSVSDVQFALCRDTYLGGLPNPFRIKPSIVPSQSAHRHSRRRRRDGYTQVHHRTLALRLTAIALLRTSESLLRWLLGVRGGCTVLPLGSSRRSPIPGGSWRGRTKRRLR